MNMLSRPGGDAAFGGYASWYDLFNAGKDYEAEARYVLDRVRAWRPSPRTWLDIGCGTGIHLAVLRTLGLQTEGVDVSPEMIARARLAHPFIAFHEATAQDFALDGDRDVISMLFHVLSYQTTDDAVEAALGNVASHLCPGGVFAFDFWHTGGVRQDPPVVRVRETRLHDRPLFRVATPTADAARSRVDVRFEFRWDSPAGPLMHEERHSMRHFARGELADFLEGAGMNMVECQGWMRQGSLAPDDWYGFVCAVKAGDA